MELTKFVEELKNTLGSNLKSIVLYGSQASGEAVKKRSDYNLLLTLENFGFTELKLLQKPVNKWIKSNNSVPVIFTCNQFEESFDVFPIEFLDMKEHHKILYGENPFVNMEIVSSNLRHECEHELKSKYLKLCQEFMATKGKQSEIKELLINSISTFLVLFRNVLRLTGQVPPPKKIDALSMLSKQVRINTEPFITVSKIKEGDKAAQKVEIEVLFNSYLNEIEKVIDFVGSFMVPRK
ncbi:MAG: nucleotidyltransferase domain-containing protein [Elusimicrobia bacterium]|nr:nucleotidyltransferase domain-containing protein [Elusimicrobiota bacterium]MBU2615445.1 nucleotidyltransferase domain-containing protein [Elusimicrobiota bacterium]